MLASVLHTVIIYFGISQSFCGRNHRLIAK